MKCSQCRNDFDDYYSFCPHCGKEREQATSEKVIVSTASTYLHNPLDKEQSKEYEDNIAFLRYFYTSPWMLIVILLLCVSSLFSLFQLIDLLANPIDADTIIGMAKGSPVISIISYIISVMPIIGLVIVYIQAKRPYALTGSGFYLIGKFALINIWFYRIAGVLLALFALLLLFSSYAVILIAFLPLLLLFPVYFLLLATKELCEMLEYSIDRDPMGTLPYPDRVQKWLKWLTIEYVIIFVITILLVYVFEMPIRWSDAAETLSENVWLFLIQSLVFGFGWYFVKEYTFLLLNRKKNESLEPTNVTD